MRRVFVLLAGVVMLWLVLQRESRHAPASDARTPASTTNTPKDAAPIPPGTAQTPPQNTGKGFRDHAHLAEHFAKHGREFGAVSETQYLALAQTLRDAPAGGDILEVIRAGDGVVSRFDKRSGAFLAFNRDGTIRTFFKPNDGEKYFRRQVNRVPNQ